MNSCSDVIKAVVLQMAFSVHPPLQGLAKSVKGHFVGWEVEGGGVDPSDLHWDHIPNFSAFLAPSSRWTYASFIAENGSRTSEGPTRDFIYILLAFWSFPSPQNMHTVV